MTTLVSGSPIIQDGKLVGAVTHVQVTPWGWNLAGNLLSAAGGACLAGRRPRNIVRERRDGYGRAICGDSVQRHGGIRVLLPKRRDGGFQSKLSGPAEA